MKYLLTITILVLSFSNLKAQNLPEFNDKPAYIDHKTHQLVDLEKSQYNTLAKAKGIFSAEGGFFLDGASSNTKIAKQQELKFVIKVTPGTDPTSVFDLAKFDVKKNKRLFITTKSNVTSTSTSIAKINYEVRKIKDGYYYLIAKNLDKGEYFFGSNDFMFAFSVE